MLLHPTKELYYPGAVLARRVTETHRRNLELKLRNGEGSIGENLIGRRNKKT